MTEADRQLALIGGIGGGVGTGVAVVIALGLLIVTWN